MALPCFMDTLIQTWHNLLFAHVSISPEKSFTFVPLPSPSRYVEGKRELRCCLGCWLHGDAGVGLVSHFPNPICEPMLRLAASWRAAPWSMYVDNPLAIQLA